MTQPSGAADAEATKDASSRIRWSLLDALFAYFVVALAMIALVQPIGAFFVRAGADPVMAALSEATATLLVLLSAAGWIVQGFNVPSRTGARLVIGVGAMALLLASGVALALLIPGIPPWALARRFANPEGVVIAASLVLGALLPAIRVRGRGA